MRSTRSIAAGVLRLTLVFVAAACVAQNNPAPVVFQPLTPDHIAPGTVNPVTVTVRGANFVADSIVNWNGSPRTTTYVSKSSLRAVINPTDVAATGTGAVSVTNPLPGGGTSNVVYLPIHRPQTTVALAEHDYSGEVRYEYPLWGGALGDFNGDGLPDFAVVNSFTSTIDVLPGNGTGSFGTTISTPITLMPTTLLVGDFNGDGKLDLFGWNVDQENGTVMFLGNGDGTFTQQSSPSINGSYFVTGDFNRDGNLDLVTVTTTGLSISLGNGNGTFGAQTLVYKSKTGQLYNPIVGDFNGDGILDIAIVEHIGSPTEYYVLDMFEGKGDGTFYKTKTTTLPNVFTTGVAGDVNHDGKLDIVGNFDVLLLNNGDGTFNVSSIDAYSDVQLVDMNNDGNLDIVGFGQLSGDNLPAISLQLGNGDGTFQPRLTWSAQSLGNYPQMGIADWNSDGLLDTAFPTDSYVVDTPFSVYLQTGLNISPTLVDFGQLKVGTNSSPQTITLTNTTTGALKLDAIKTTGEVAQFSSSTTCGTSLATGASCTITLVFSPTVVRDGFQEVIEVIYGQPTGPQYITVLGKSVN
jgi:hypothetical protein